MADIATAEPRFITVNEEMLSDPKVEQARAEVEQTRAELSETIDALKEALSPHHLVEEAKEAAYDATIGKATSALDTVKSTVSDAIEGAKPMVSHAVEVATETVTHAYESATSAVSHAVESATSAVTGAFGAASENINHTASAAGSGISGAIDSARDTLRNVVRPENRDTDDREILVTSNAGTAKGAGQMILDTIKQNPLATTLIGLGIGLLVVNARRNSTNTDTIEIVEVDIVEIDDMDDLNEYGGAPSASYASEADYNNSTVNPLNANATSQGTSVGDRLNDAKSGIAGAASQVQNKAGELASNVQGKAGEIAHNVQGKAGEIAHNVQGKAGEVAGTVQKKAGEVASTVQSKAGEVASTVQSTAQSAWTGVGNTLQENPLAVGAVAVILGAALGLVLPRTPQENQVMGETRDKLKAQATGLVQDTTHKVQTVAQEVLGTTVQTVKDTVQEKAHEQGLTS